LNFAHYLHRLKTVQLFSEHINVRARAFKLLLSE